MMFSTDLEWSILLISTLLLALLVFWDFKSRGSRWRVWRLLCNALIVISLIGLYTKPYFEVPAPEVKVALLTPSKTVVNTDSLEQEGYSTVSSVNAYLDLRNSNQVTDFLVFGDGLEPWELSQIKGEYRFISSSILSEGLVDFEGKELVAKTQNELTVQVQSNDDLMLQLSGTGIDTVQRKVTRDEVFVSFNVVPKIEGRFAFQLMGLIENDTLFNEIVPVTVLERKVVNTLVLTNTPSFEVRFLKNLLKTEGYGVAERLQVSKDVYRESFSNLNKRSLRQISNSLLDDFDLLVLDKASWDQLSQAERSRISNALEKGNLGIVWMDVRSSSWMKLRSVAEKSVQLKAGAETIDLRQTVTSSGYSDVISLQNQSIGHIHKVGLGVVMLPLLSSSYQLQLKGHASLYSSFWNELLKPTIGFDLVEKGFEMDPFPRVNQPSQFSFQADELVEVYYDSGRVAIAEKWQDPDNYAAKLWPSKQGWNEVKVGEQLHSFYVYDSASWPVQNTLRKRRQTKAFAQELEVGKTNQSITIRRQISPWIFFGLLVFSFGFLWAESRMA